MNIVFFGSSKYSTIVEKALNEKFGLSLVVTVPDKPVGRKQIITPSPVKKIATENGVPVLTFEKLNEKATRLLSPEPTRLPSEARRPGRSNGGQVEEIKKYNPDFLVVADYGLILPKELLELSKLAPLNVHHSLLPKYRGPSPAPTAILNGDKLSGVTVIKMSEKMDSGLIFAQKEYELKKEETTDSLLKKLNELGAELVIEVINNFKQITPVAQDESKATYTQKMKKDDGYFDINNPLPVETIDRMIRAFYPWPNVWTKLRIRNQELKIKFLPNKVIQVEGKKPMSIKDFVNGYPEAGVKILKILNPH